MLLEIGFGFRGLYTKRNFFRGLISFHDPLFFPSFNVTFVKLEDAMCVTSAYQERAGLNTLTVENWKYY